MVYTIIKVMKLEWKPTKSNSFHLQTCCSQHHETIMYLFGYLYQIISIYYAILVFKYS
jgi:hypothetical protein